MNGVGRWGGRKRDHGMFCENFAGGQGCRKVDLEGVAAARVDGRGGGLIGNVRWMSSGERESWEEIWDGEEGESRKGCRAENSRGGVTRRRADREGRVEMGAGRWRWRWSGGCGGTANLSGGGGGGGGGGLDGEPPG